MISRRLLRYVLVGGSAFVIELCSIYVLRHFFHLSNVAAVAISFWIGLVVSFVLQKIIAFENHEKHPHIIGRQVLLFAALVAWNYLFTLLVVHLLTGVVSVFIVRALTIGIITIWNYRIYGIIFKRRTTKKPAVLHVSKPTVKKKRRKNKRKKSRLAKLLSKPDASRTYLLLAYIIIFLTTFVWSLLGSAVHQTNADQLVNPYLLENNSTFQHALFPTQHTFLLKWPLFLITHLFGESRASYQTMTVLISLLTVAGLVFILRRIERRPFALGTLLLMLASVLWIIPAQPYPGGLLPLNMAMIVTRNLEYLIYIGSVYLIIKATQVRDKRWIYGTLGLTILVASDKLFLSLSLGAALFAFIVYIGRQKWNLIVYTGRWLVASIVTFMGSLLILRAFSSLGITKFSEQGTGPYSLIGSFGQLAHAILFGVIGYISNFGANPAFHTIAIRDLAYQSLLNMFGFGGPTILINLVICLAGILAAGFILKTSLSHTLSKNGAIKNGSAYPISLALIWTTLAALAAFVFTDHYYAVDARYLTIGLFAAFICLATYARTKRWQADQLIIAGAIIVCAMVLSTPFVIRSYNQDVAATNKIMQRNDLIVQALRHHPVNTVLGDYWRVIPIKQMSGATLSVTPLSDCTAMRDVLSSTKWQPDLRTSSFAYILSLDKGLTDFSACDAETIVKAYGKPNTSVVIAGDIDSPKELLLFYDHGTHKNSQRSSGSQGVLDAPIELRDLVLSPCPNATIMNIVAHQDDDLLFLNPDLQHDITAGNCIRTVYITAGDAGSEEFYWLNREQGSEAAYLKLIGTDSLWLQRTVRLKGNQFISVVSPKNNPNISLIFLRLPDGNINSEGFYKSKHVSLEKLLQGRIPTLHSVYGDSTYTKDGLTAALSEIMQAYQPSEIRTQSIFKGQQYHDHSDHMAVSGFSDLAYQKYQTEIGANPPLVHYIGYPVHEMPENVAPEDLALKAEAFFAYAKHDPSVCQSIEQCDTAAVYGIYLRRQYRAP